MYILDHCSALKLDVSFTTTSNGLLDVIVKHIGQRDALTSMKSINI